MAKGEIQEKSAIVGDSQFDHSFTAESGRTKGGGKKEQKSPEPFVDEPSKNDSTQSLI